MSTNSKMAGGWVGTLVHKTTWQDGEMVMRTHSPAAIGTL